MSFISKLTKGADKRIEMPIDMGAGEYQDAPMIGDSNQPVTPEPKRPVRIGDLDAVPYIASTNENLGRIAAKYRTELSALIADIDKLTEDKRQIIVALNALDVAITALERGDHAPGSAPYRHNDGITPGGEPARGVRVQPLAVDISLG